MSTAAPPTTLDWLSTCPAGDTNFAGALKKATADELRTALEIRRKKPGSKGACKALEVQLRKLQGPPPKATQAISQPVSGRRFCLAWKGGALVFSGHGATGDPNLGPIDYTIRSRAEGQIDSDGLLYLTTHKEPGQGFTPEGLLLAAMHRWFGLTLEPPQEAN